MSNKKFFIIFIKSIEIIFTIWYNQADNKRENMKIIFIKEGWYEFQRTDKIY